MKKVLGIFWILIGSILVIISILALIKGFDAFTQIDGSTDSIGYFLGCTIFPLFITVLGRWVVRKGRGMLKETKRKEGT